MWYGYERSAAIYTYAEIGAYGFINSLKWYVGTSDLNTCPIKIYLKNHKFDNDYIWYLGIRIERGHPCLRWNKQFSCNRVVYFRYC